MEGIRYYVELPEFKGRNVPIAEIAKAIGKDAQYIRYGLQKGYLHLVMLLSWKIHQSTITTVQTGKYGKKPDILSRRKKPKIMKNPCLAGKSF